MDGKTAGDVIDRIKTLTLLDLYKPLATWTIFVACEQLWWGAEWEPGTWGLMSGCGLRQ